MEGEKPQQQVRKQNWKRKPARFKKITLQPDKKTTTATTESSQVIKERKATSGSAYIRSNKTDKKTVTTSRKRIQEKYHSQEVVGREQKLAHSLNRLPNIAATRALKFPGLNSNQTKQDIIQSVKSAFEQTPYKTIFLALSGGLDSAVTAGLVAEAVGRQKLRLIHFIELDRPAVEKSNAELIARSLGITLEVRDCREQARQHMAELKITNELRRNSLLCRERMASLLTLAENDNGFVICGINKTKWILGRTVPYGDNIGLLNPIGDLYHSQVIDLARAINVPKVILDYAEKSALLPGMTPHDPLTISWKEADFYLYQMLDVRLSLAYIMTLGVDEEKVKLLYRMIRESGFKRQLPAIPELVQNYNPRSGDTV